MNVEITPEPEPEERPAILAAVAKLLAGSSSPGRYRSAWGELGVRENLGDDQDEGRG